MPPKTKTQTSDAPNQAIEQALAGLVLSPGADGPQIVVKGPAKGRWRIGRHFTPEPTHIPVSELTEAQAEALLADPELTVIGALPTEPEQVIDPAS